MNELIITVGAVCAAILSIAGVIKLLYSVIKQMNKMSNESKEQSKTLKDVELNVLRLTIMSSEMPLSERITAGDIYTKKGGNGAVHAKYEELLEEYKKETQEFSSDEGK